jgi:transposase-like protein
MLTLYKCKGGQVSMNKEIIRYSDAFKLQVVSELESGKFKCIFEARKRYDIRGCGTIDSWMRKYGKNHLLNKVVIVKTTEERDQLKAMKQENHKLKAALGDAYLDLRLERAYVAIACEQAGIADIDTFKKKADTNQ